MTPPLGQVPGTPGRRLRLMRRKAALDQEGLARILNTDKATVSQMENNAVSLTPEAEAFLANPPARVPASPRPPRVPRPSPEPQPEEPLSSTHELPEDVSEPPAAGDGPGPRVGAAEDRPPRSAAAPKPQLLPRKGEIDDLERALLTLFAGETFLVPREQPDGTVLQVEAVVPGMAQMIGMVDEFDGMMIRTYAPGMARAWAELARENATVRKILFGLTYGGAYRGVIAASLPPLMAIALHHGAFGLGAPKATVEDYSPPPQPQATDPFSMPDYADNGDGTWTAPNGLVGVFGPNGFVSLDQVPQQ